MFRIEIERGPPLPIIITFTAWVVRRHRHVMTFESSPSNGRNRYSSCPGRVRAASLGLPTARPPPSWRSKSPATLESSGFPRNRSAARPPAPFTITVTGKVESGIQVYRGRCLIRFVDRELGVDCTRGVSVNGASNAERQIEQGKKGDGRKRSAVGKKIMGRLGETTRRVKSCYVQTNWGSPMHIHRGDIQPISAYFWRESRT